MKENWKLPSLALAVTLLSATSVYALERAAPTQLAQAGPDDQRGGGGPGGGGREPRGGGDEGGGGGGKARGGGGGGEEGGGRPARQERQERQGGGGGDDAGERPERPARPARDPDAEPAPKKAPAPAARDEQPPAPKKERPPRDDAGEAPAKKAPPPVEKAAPPVEKKAPPPAPKAEPEPKAVPKEAPKAAPKEEPEPKAIPKEAPKAAPKEEPKAGGPKDEPVPGKKSEPKEPGPKGAEPAGEPKGDGLPPSGKEPRGDRDRKGPDGKGPEGKGPDGKGPEGKGPEGKGPEGKGPEGKGPEGKGPEGKGPEGKQPGEPKGPPGPPIRDGKAPEAGPSGPGGPAAAPSEVKDLKELKEERKERTEDGGKRVIIEEPDKRSIVKEGGQTIIRHDETERFRRLDQGKIRREKRNGLDISISLGVGGIEIYTETDDRGRALRRYRRDREGREVILFDNRDYYRRHNDGSFVDAIVDLPPPRIGIPRERYILDYEEASDIDVYETLSAPPVEELDRSYSMEEVRRSPMLRDRMPRVDLDAINFEFGAWEVTQDQYPALERVAKAMRRVIDRNPAEMFLIEGHTDAVGSDEDNLSLSDRRAESVAIILTEQFGVPPENLTTQGYGEQYLKIDTQAAERQNRRVAVRRVTPLLSRSK